MTPELIADYECVIGEGPLWHPGEGCVYWTDISYGANVPLQPGERSARTVLRR